MSQLSSAANKQKKCAGCGKEGADLKNCSACLSVCYCSSACQRAGWPGHRAACKKIQLRIKAKEEGGGSGVGDVGTPSTAPLSSVKRYREANIRDVCARGHHEELLKMLKDSDLDVNWADPTNGITAAFVAASQGHDKCLTAIIQYGGADLSKRNTDGWAPIHVACAGGRIACLLVLLDRDVDANVRTLDVHSFTPVLLCCMAGHVKCLMLLLDRGASPNLADSGGLTPAHAASTKSSMKCLQLLIARRANFNARDVNGDTPLDNARHAERPDCVELLLENNAVGSRVEDLHTLPEAEKVRLSYVSEYVPLLAISSHDTLLLSFTENEREE
jgi:ankyrin repeat protein